jgi:hypothetical protein
MEDEVSDSRLTAPAPEPAAGQQAPSLAGTGGDRAGADLTLVSVLNPLSVPYRTGSYLIYDYPRDTDECPGKLATDNFRSGSKLRVNPYRASGSHQLDCPKLLGALENLPQPQSVSKLFLVDLREEAHGFLGGRAVSWYADNDFSNVGCTEKWIHEADWIRAEEEYRMASLANFSPVAVFCIEQEPKDNKDNRDQQRMRPTGYRMVDVQDTRTEQQAFHGSPIGHFTVKYVRIPVTDHCAPADDAIDYLCHLADRVAADDWVHFHCHGGDGRTTTFLALYDMLCWKKAGHPNVPSVEGFACRQCQLFNYCLNPSGCRNPDRSGCGCKDPVPDPFKTPLAKKRWESLKQFHKRLFP